MLEALTDRTVRNLFPAKVDRTSRAFFQACQAKNQLTLTIPIDACNTNDLPCTDLEANVLHRIFFMRLRRYTQPFYVQDHFSRLCRFFGNLQLDWATYHHVGQRLLIRVLCFYSANILSLSQHGDTIGDRHDLVELMRDKEDRLSFCGQVFHNLHQLINFLGRKHSGRLVEN